MLYFDKSKQVTILRQFNGDGEVFCLVKGMGKDDPKYQIPFNRLTVRGKVIDLESRKATKDNNLSPETETDKTEQVVKVEINSSRLTAREMADALPGGVGMATANKILKDRKKQPNQKFENLDALKAIQGITVQWDEIEHLISFEVTKNTEDNEDNEA
ncbi:MAG: hypothetical protein AAGA83_00335 [Cyanobacteria bacterium P01_F01_bin.116]